MDDTEGGAMIEPASIADGALFLGILGALSLFVLGTYRRGMRDPD